MKRILTLLLLLLSMGCCAMAQAGADSATTASTGNVLTAAIPQSLNIKDNIFLVNKSPYLILQAMVALPQPDGTFEPLGTTTLLAAGERAQIASYARNGLKRLRGKTLAVKVKGAKVMAGQKRSGVVTPMGDVGAATTEISPDLINNIDPNDITYDYDVRLYEAHHDLYIEVYYKGKGGSVMDF